MTARAWGTYVALAVVAATGCRGPKHYHVPADVIPPPANRDGTEIVIQDARPDWEKRPFVGAVSLYHPGKVRPNAWDQIAAETAAVAAQMPEKPQRVTVAVTSLRLVRLDEDRLNGELLTGHVTLPVSFLGITVPFYQQKPEDLYPKAVTEHPAGASCAVEAEVTVETPGRPPRTIPVKALAGGPAMTGAVYRGDIMDEPVKHAVFQFGREFRSAVGLPPDG